MMKYLFLFICFVSFTLFAFSQENSDKNNNTAEMSFEYTNFNFDTIVFAQKAECIFQYTNIGTAPLQITKVTSSCGCTIPYWTKDPIAVGDTAHISVSYNTRRSGKFSRGITVFSNSQNSPIVLTIEGVVTKNKNKFIIE